MVLVRKERGKGGDIHGNRSLTPWKSYSKEVWWGVPQIVTKFPPTAVNENGFTKHGEESIMFKSST